MVEWLRSELQALCSSLTGARIKPSCLSCLLSLADFFVDLHNEFASRSARRRKEALREHEARLEELKDRQNLRQLLFKTNPDSPQLLGPSESNPPTLENTVPQNMSHTASNPLLKAPSPTFQMSKAPKGIGEDGSQKKEKGEGSDTAKTASKGVKK